jgi:ABC-type glycerol-3-phosphate transport system permease component
MATKVPSLRAHAAPLRATLRRVKAGIIIWYVAAVLMAVVFLTPFVWLFISVLRTPTEMASFQPQFRPAHPQWHYFHDSVTWPFLPADFWAIAWNSLRLSLWYSVFVVITSAMTGFAFARLKGPGKNVLFGIMLSTMMIPGIIYIYPLFIMYSRLGFIYTDRPWIAAGLGASAYLSFLYRQFFSAIPLELEDAAIVDGCGYWRIFIRIFLPLSRPAVATAAIFSFQYVWNDYIQPSIYLRPDQTTLAYIIGGGSYTDQNGNPILELLAAGAFFYMIPVLALFFIAQRFFISGQLAGGLKG